MSLVVGALISEAVMLLNILSIKAAGSVSIDLGTICLAWLMKRGRVLLTLIALLCWHVCSTISKYANS